MIFQATSIKSEGVFVFVCGCTRVGQTFMTIKGGRRAEHDMPFESRDKPFPEKGGPTQRSEDKSLKHRDLLTCL